MFDKDKKTGSFLAKGLDNLSLSPVEMSVKDMVSMLAERREQLGMSDYHIAQRSGVSQPTVHRFLSGKSQKISLENALAIAYALGAEMGCVIRKDVGVLREEQAAKKAREIASMTQATSALEGQGIDKKTWREIHDHAQQKFLAGSAKDLWSE